MTKAEAFTQATQKNALRRESGLPLYEVRDEMDRISYGEQLIKWRDATREYAADRQRIIDEVLAEKRAEHGPDYGKGGMHVVFHIATQRFTAFLEVRGFRFPKRPDAAGPAVVYGESIPPKAE